ncbi:MAG: LAGLIDADG family homing endonuclease [Halobacteria archaeon]|nr:LAGLIDADG family homing endonuclease [Halobacteria archaeon]
MSLENVELTEKWESFYRSYYDNEIGKLAQKYPREERSLYIDFQDLFQYDPELAEDLRRNPEEMLRYAEEALHEYDVPVADVRFADANLRIRNVGEITEIRGIRSKDVNTLISVEGIVRKATEVRPKAIKTVFECERCGTTTTITQTDDSSLREPYECKGCERQGPFSLLFDQSEFVDSQKVRVQESPEDLRGGENPQTIDVEIEDDITGEVTPGDRVTVVGILRATQDGDSTTFDVFIEGNNIEIEDQEFEEFKITDEDEETIEEIANSPDVYEKIVDSIAPGIYGYETEKLAMALQLFSGVTKNLPDETRIRGDMHILMVGDPGTAKCVAPGTRVTLGDGRDERIENLVETHLEDPKEVDDGVYDDADFSLPSLGRDASVRQKNTTRVWKRTAPDRMYRIETSTGKELEVTPTHPLFVHSDAKIEGVRAEDLEEGDFIATPNETVVKGDDSLDTEYKYRKSKANNSVSLDLPDEITPQMSRLLGYIVAEGYVQSNDDNTGTVYVTNKDTEILEDVERGLESLGLGLNTSVRETHEGKTTKEIVCSSSEFVSFLENLSPSLLKPSRDKRVPEAVMTSTDKVRSDFLSAYVDAEGTVSEKQREISVSSTSEELIDDVSTLLLSVGISSQKVSEDDGYSYSLRISGSDYTEFFEKVGLVTRRKSERAERFSSTSHNTNRHVVPDIGEKLREVRDGLRLPQSDCGVPRTTYQHYERGDRNPSVGSLEEIADRFETRRDELRELKRRLRDDPDWSLICETRESLRVSQESLASSVGVSQAWISGKENEGIADGGSLDMGSPDEETVRADAVERLREEIDDAVSYDEDILEIRKLAESSVLWDRIESIEKVDPDYDYVYDLEVEETHNFVTNGVFSHNSQLLQYVKKIAPRGVYTSGKGSSAAGLTAAAVQDDFGDGKWTLEAGALVLADKGIACVDEVDKMDPKDRSALHEALEQQSVSISKAGINATLKSRCALLGAANPKYGRFDEYEGIAEQIELEPALISRFDLIFTVTDEADEEKDSRLAEHILTTNYAGEVYASDSESRPEREAEDADEIQEEIYPEIESEMLRKYVAYSRRECKPQMTDEARDRVRDFYVDLRSEGEGSDVIPITARKLEALVRLAEASARMRLSDEVEVEDAERAIDIVKESLRDVSYDPETGQLDADIVETGHSSSQRERIKDLSDIIQTIADEREDGKAPRDEILETAEDHGMEREKAQEELKTLQRNGEVIEPSHGHFRLV